MLSCGLFSGGQNEVVEVFVESRALVVLEQIVEQERMLERARFSQTGLSRARHNFSALQSVSILDASKPSHDLQ
jgi:hypothetical protein